MADYSVQILDSIRGEASAEYQNRVPESTQATFEQIANAITSYDPVFNEFCNALVHKIGLTIIEQKLFKNRLARFKSGAVTSQQDVEEIWIAMAKAEGAYDKNGSNPLGRRDYPEVKALYHRMNRQDKYVLSVGDLDFRRAFTSEATFSSFVKGMINSLYSGANYDEFLHMKNLITDYAKGKCTAHYFVPAIADKFAETADTTQAGLANLAYNKWSVKDICKTIKKAIYDLTVEPSDKYNVAEVMTWSEENNLVLFINKDVLAEMESEKIIPEGVEIIPLADLGTENRYGILMDGDWARVFDTLHHMETQRNADGMFTNYFLHIHQILSGSHFKNFVTIDKEG